MDGDRLTDIVDPTVLGVLIRNTFETVGIFNLVYRSASTDDEKNMLYNLWCIAGLSYRQRFRSNITTEQTRRKAEVEGQQIIELVAEIEMSVLFRNFDEANKDKIRNRIKRKEYLIKFVDGQVVFLSWQDLIQQMGIRFDFFDNIYTLFSLYGHPSFVSVFQFGDMFSPETNAFKHLSITYLKFAVYFTCIFIADYENLFPNIKSTFEKLPIEHQIMIDGVNGMLRGPSFFISKCLDILN